MHELGRGSGKRTRCAERTLAADEGLAATQAVPRPRPTLALVASLLLSGCAHTQTVIAPCIAKNQALPSEPDKVAGKLTGRADEDTKILAGGLIRWQTYAMGLRQILETCR